MSKESAYEAVVLNSQKGIFKANMYELIVVQGEEKFHEVK